ncbi:hypothetical protein L596_002293 [Steinernema carpocapsae]|uniref:Uncharacterized protein n=1 Tax=Steinernema carpocapsae TaxID=34508 RepID=A0A4U8USS1_STECR|nr:hypothetical protein L596_002293 [Steinernema carpocapsae]
MDLYNGPFFGFPYRPPPTQPHPSAPFDYASKVCDGAVGSSLELQASCLDLSSTTDNSATNSANQLALIGAAAAGAQSRTSLTPHLNPMDPYPLTSHIHSPKPDLRWVTGSDGLRIARSLTQAST